MTRQLFSSRRTVFLLLFLAALLWFFWDFLFPKKLDNSDIVVMRKAHYMDASGCLIIGVKNVCKARPSQYKDFLPKIAATLADTVDEKTEIYFIMHDPQTEQRVPYLAPYEFKEEIPDELLLMQNWDCGKEPTFVHWYIPALEPLNTYVPDLLHLEDTRVEQVK